MRRNIGSELLVALFAAVSLLFAAAFAVLLATSTSQRSTAEAVEPTTPPATPSATHEQVAPTIAEVTPEPTAVETGLPTPDEMTSPRPGETEAIGTPPDADDVQEIARANLTRTAIRETVVARRELATVSPSPTAEQPIPAATEAPIASATAAAPTPTDGVATATPAEDVREVARANLTLTAIRKSVVARRELTTVGPSPTAEQPTTAATEAPIASATAATPTDAVTNATPADDVREVARANLTRTAIRATVVARRELATERPSPTAQQPVTVLPDSPLAGATATMPTSTEAVATATPADDVQEIARANLTLTAIRATVVARRELATERPSPTAEQPTTAASEAPIASATEITPTPIDAAATATPADDVREIARANLTLTAIRETVVARRELATERPSPTAEQPETAATEAPIASAAEITPTPADAVATATEADDVREIARANLTLTDVRETVVARRELATVSPSPTAQQPETAATEAPVASATAAMPTSTEAVATATPADDVQEIARANLTLTVIRETVVARRELATVSPSPTAQQPETAATEAPVASATAAMPTSTDAVATATPADDVREIARANLTLTDIRETVVARSELAPVSPSPIAEQPVTAMPDTQIASATAATPTPPDVFATATPDDDVREIARANLTLTAIRATVVARRELATVRPSPTAEQPIPAATEAPIASATKLAPTPIDTVATATPTDDVQQIARANLTLTAIRATVSARRELATVRPSPTAEQPETSLAEAPIASATESTPTLTDAVATATPADDVREIARANLTLTAIRATVVARRELATVSPSPTAEQPVTAMTDPPIASATELAPTPIDTVATATPTDDVQQIARANLTLTAIRATVSARRELATVRPSPTAEQPETSLAEAPIASATESTPTLTDAVATATPADDVREIARANLTLTAIRATVVARRELATVSPSPTAEQPPSSLPDTPLASATESTPTLTDAVATATPDDDVQEIARADLTLTAIRETVVARRELATVRPSPTAEQPVTAFPDTPIASATAATPTPTDAVATATPAGDVREVARANLTLTAIRATVVARRELATVRPSPTAQQPITSATEATVASATAATPTPTDVVAKATLADDVQQIARANLTLTAIRATVVARRELATVRPSPTAEQPTTAATEAPIASATEITPTPADVVATATPDDDVREVARANLTLTAIRETVVARRELATVRPSPTAEQPLSSLPDTPLASATESTPTLTDAVATATPADDVSEVARANLTLTAIRATVVARRELATVSPSPTAEQPVTAATEAPIASATAAAPTPTDAVATETPDDDVREVARANLTRTAIRETVVARRELSTVSPSPTAEQPVTAATEAPLASATAAMPTPTDAVATATPDDDVREVPRANLTLTAIRATVAATRSSPRPASAATFTSTPLPQYFIYLIPTPTAFGSVEASARIDCEIAPDWLSYEVKEGDTLLSLALATGSSLIELREGNCFEPIRGIFASEHVLVPRALAPIGALPTPVMQIAAEAVGCDRHMAQIDLPAPSAQVEGVFALIGSVLLPEGGRYQIAIKPGWTEEFYMYLESDRPVSRDVLALINAEIFGVGAHRLRLAVKDSDGELIKGGFCEIPLMFGSQ